MDTIQLPSKHDLQRGLESVIDQVLIGDRIAIANYVAKLRSQHPNVSNDTLAKKIVSRKSVKNGLVGALTGVGGYATMPVAIPTDLACSWKIQIAMALSVACVYGHDNDTTDLKTDIYLILGGNAAKEALKKLGIETSKAITKKAVQKYITKDVMTKITSVIGRKIITKAGEKSMTSFMKMVPLVGAPVGFAFDWTSTQLVGKVAIQYYRG